MAKPTLKKKTSSSTNSSKTSSTASAMKEMTQSSRPATQIKAHEVALRAYSIYLSGQGGSQLDHWLQAERELLGSNEART
ncbi:MAG: hypothetical protein A2X94_13120 [Bdellovibrionales bacterium GWB1_55_8]|nr:MAG: hypothetical protein A2X94_13120 [Bdellovibrionales bacterium GWB1_55_8]